MEGRRPEKSDDDMEEELRILEEMKAVYHKNIIRRQVEKPVRTNFFKDVPDRVLNDILVKVPSKDLYENAILVCHKWRQLISSNDFSARIFLSARDKLLIGTTRFFYSYEHLFTVKEMEMSEQLECKLHGFGFSSRMGRVRSSCNGLMLVNHPTEKGVLKVMNPTTRVCLTLPRCPSGCPHKSGGPARVFDPICGRHKVVHGLHKACGLALGFDPISKVYKVVHIYADAFGFEIADLTSSELTWRRIPGPWEALLLDRPFNIDDFSWHDPVSVNNGRYLHWFVDSNQYIISMDITEETFTRTNLPYIEQNIETQRYNLVELGGCLAFTYTLSDCQLDVWVLEDFTKQSWSKKHSVMTELVNYVVWENPGRFDNVLPKMNKLVPVVSLNDGKVLVLKHDSCLYLYDMGSRVMKKFKMTMKKHMFFIVHRSSMLHWNQVDRDLSLSGLVI